MPEDLRKKVCHANQLLVKYGLVSLTWGNVSGIDRKKGLIVIKPSGIPFEELQPENMALVDMDGKPLPGSLNPSSDTPTHIELYKKFMNAGSIVHTHSPWATVWAQAGKSIPPLGTTHADHFYGEIPCTRKLTEQEIKSDYETSTGKVIVETFAGRDPAAIPAVLVHGHGPFVWGKDCKSAIENAVALEMVAKMAYHTLQLNDVKSIDRWLLDKHYNRKHGKEAYYGQGKKNQKSKGHE